MARPGRGMDLVGCGSSYYLAMAAASAFNQSDYRRAQFQLPSCCSTQHWLSPALDSCPDHRFLAIGPNVGSRARRHDCWSKNSMWHHRNHMCGYGQPLEVECKV